MSNKLYEFIKINDVPTMSEEYIGEIKSKSVSHSKVHRFNFDNKEQKQKLIDIIKRYGLTTKDFTEQDKNEHPFFYKILSNNLRESTGLVYYYYNPELLFLDERNKPYDREKFANGILLYNNDEIESINRYYRLTEKKYPAEKIEGYRKNTLEDFKNFFLSKRQGHDYKKDLEEILSAEDNAVEYLALTKGRYYNKETGQEVEKPILHTAKSPRIAFILSKTNLTEESKDKFKKYEDLKNFVENFEASEFEKNELVEFFKAVDRIVKNYALHQDLVKEIEEVKKNNSIV